MNAHLELSLHKKKMIEKNRMQSRMKEKVIGCRGCGFGTTINKRFHAHVQTMKHENLEVRLEMESASSADPDTDLDLSSKEVEVIHEDEGGDQEKVVEDVEEEEEEEEEDVL